MPRRTYLVVGIAVAVIVILGVALAVAQEQSAPDLPALTPAQLLAEVAEQAPRTSAANGDFTWTNDLLGAALQLPGGGEGLSAFLKNGSGRLWLQRDGARLESQTPSGDTVVVSNGSTLWVYNSNDPTVTEYTLPAHDDQDKTTTTAPLNLSAQIQGMVEKLAPTASLAVTQDRVAGRDTYVLVLTPTADNTVFGSAQVAFDAEHFVPLRLQVFARSGADPVFSAGFSRVSFDPADASMFTFTPPTGTKVEKKELKLPQGIVDLHKSGDTDEAKGKWLSLEEAQAEAGFDLALPENPPLPFAEARVFPAHEAGSPVVVLTYGQGFGTVIVVETKVSQEQLNQLLQSMQPGRLLPRGAPDSGSPQGGTSTTGNEGANLAALGALVKPTTINAHPAFEIDTRLGSAIAWQQGELGVLIAGSVSPEDLTAFAASFR